jgi:hypothetical protein
MESRGPNVSSAVDGRYASMDAVEGNVQRAAAAVFASTVNEKVVASGATEWVYVSIKNSRAGAKLALR